MVHTLHAAQRMSIIWKNIKEICKKNIHRCPITLLWTVAVRFGITVCCVSSGILPPKWLCAAVLKRAAGGPALGADARWYGVWINKKSPRFPIQCNTRATKRILWTYGLHFSQVSFSTPVSAAVHLPSHSNPAIGGSIQSILIWWSAGLYIPFGAAPIPANRYSPFRFASKVR